MVFFFNSIYFYSLMLSLHHAACEILVCELGTEPRPPAAEVQSRDQGSPQNNRFSPSGF